MNRFCTVTNNRLTASRRRLRKQVCFTQGVKINAQPVVKKLPFLFMHDIAGKN